MGKEPRWWWSAKIGGPPIVRERVCVRREREREERERRGGRGTHVLWPGA